jgi:transcriptional regulator with XRE-family HTH domain
MKVNLYICNYRQQRGLSQQFTARQLGVTVKTYARLERGEGKLTIELLAEIGKILEVNPLLLFSISMSPKEHFDRLEEPDPESIRHYNALIDRLENQLMAAQAENSKLRKILMKRW